MSVAGLLLAAGAGRRYGGPKALAVIGGRLLVESGLATLRDGGCAPVVVVLGAGADEIRDRADLAGATVVVNSAWATGMGSSLRAGLVALEPTHVESAVVLLVDLPGVTAAAVRRVASHTGAGALAVATYPGGSARGGGDTRRRRAQVGHPVLLGRTHWAGVADLAIGDVGARPYLAAHAAAVTPVPCADLADGADVDEPAAHA